MLTAAMLRSALDYDLNTGIFTWKEGGRGRGRKKGGRAGSVKISRGHKSRQINVNGYNCTAAYAAWLYVTGEPPKGILEYKDNDSLNDAFDNLRPSNYSGIQKSRCKGKNNTTGIIGVSWRKSEGGHYAVSIGNGANGVYLGRTRDFFEACCMRKSAEKRYNYNVSN